MIKVYNLNKVYEPGTRRANHVLHDIALTLPDTGFVCIVGASGCGKTSLLNAIGGLDSFQNGAITTDSISVDRYDSREMEQERNNAFGYIFQNYYLLSDHSVAYNVYLGLHALDLTHREKLLRVQEALEAVNMDRFVSRTVSDLSGGQQQRVAIARALARRPRVIFADEPTGNLDEKNTINICTLLRRISKTSLVVMVTHEEHIARFFADRIITLSEGRIESDSDSWERGTLTPAGNELYAGDFEEKKSGTEEVELRVLHKKGAPPAKLTVVVMENQIILKLDDGRRVSCSASGEEPILLEGNRPELKLEMMDNDPEAEALAVAEQPTTGVRAGKGLTWRMMLDEALSLLKGKGKGVRFLTTWVFLVAMTVLTTYIVSDYVTLSSVDPHDFILTDSHILELTFERGPTLHKNEESYLKYVVKYNQHLRNSGLEYDMLPRFNATLSYSTDVYVQMGNVSAKLTGFSPAYAHHLSESDLICGRLPERSDEIVVDRWVLDNFLAKEGIIQSSIPDITTLLGETLEMYKSSYAPTIVGICDCGDPTIYFTKNGMACVGKAGSNVMTLSELQDRFPGEYDHLVLREDEVIIVLNNTGAWYKNKIGYPYQLGYSYKTTIVDAIEADTWAKVIVSEETLDSMLTSMSSTTTTMLLYCEDKAAVKAYMEQGMPEDLEGKITLTVNDVHGDSWASYLRASNLKADARTIITVTIIFLCVVMLYLLQRSGVQQRIGMMTVYRLLGIPRRKLLLIFSIESLMFSLISVLPASALTYLVFQTLNRLPSLEFDMILPLNICAGIAIAIMLYYLVVSLLPTSRLLKLPPAQLTAKYDL